MEAIGSRTMRLACRLTAEELEERQKALVEQTQSRELRELSLQSFLDAKRAEQKVYEADILHTANECFRLAKIIRTGEELRDVKVVDYLAGEMPDYGQSVISVREDTGEQTGIRAPTTEELQRALPLGGIP